MQNASGNDKRNFDIFACSSSTNVSCPLGVIHIEKKLLTFPNILICRISFLFLPSWYQRLLIVYWWNKTPNVDYINWISD